jgi:hypothetical protein
MISIFKKKNEGVAQLTSHSKLKKLFDMVKSTKSNPVFKQDGVKKVFFIKYQFITSVNLTAMP